MDSINALVFDLLVEVGKTCDRAVLDVFRARAAALGLEC